MVRILVIDDEENIRLGLRSILEQADLGAASIHACADGEEAFAYLKAEPVDLIIADIRMPGLSGLQLMEKLRTELRSLTPVIFLSGHDDFDYAVKAIQLQASAYLLKPVDIPELIETVRQTLQKIHPNRLMYDVCAAKIQSLLTEEEPGNWRYFEQFELFRQPYTVCIASLGPAGADRLLTEYQAHVRPAFTFMPFRHGAGRLLCLCAEAPELPAEIRNADCLSVSGVHHTAAELPRALREAREAEEYHCILSAPTLRYADLSARSMRPLPHDAVKTLKGLSGLSHEEIRKTVDGIFSPELAQSTDIRYFYETETLIYDSILSQYDMFSYGREDFEKGSLRRMGLERFREKLKQHLCRLNGILTGSAETENGAKQKHGAINRAISFIHDNFDKDINMAVVANHVSLNYYYFSDMFKKQTGKSFVDYLKELRIGHAKELLQNRSAKISRVSQECGYEDSRQFSRVFKELTGVTPKDYRRTLR